MAYCVHCGVRLAPPEEKCPLCGVVSMDPLAEPEKEAAVRPFPVRSKEQALQISRKYALSLFSLLLLLPAGLCLLLDLIGGHLTWSIYPAGVLLMIWVAVAVPLLFKKHRLYSTLIITGLALLGYLRMVEVFSDTEGWFFPIVLPSLLLVLTCLCLLTYLLRKKRIRALTGAGIALLMAMALALVVELLLIQAVAQEAALKWSPYVMAPCFFLALLMFLIVHNRALYDELRRKFHI